jgi:8-oxo-dGTP pyrophosphatase MutT (NUDIX family)
MLPDTVSRMPWTSDFVINRTSIPPSIKLSDWVVGKSDSPTEAADKISGAFAKVVDEAIERDIFDILHQRHSEPYLVAGARVGKGAVVRIERFAHSLFGIMARGSHLTAYTYVKPDRKSNQKGFIVEGKGELKIWVAKRSPKLFTFPGKLDSTVAGGIKAHSTPARCIIEEADEEASLESDFVEPRLQHVGVLTYVTEHKSFASSDATAVGPDGIRVRKPGRESGLISPEALYLFDLPLPTDVKPETNDDEVEHFKLMSVPEIKRALFAGEFKTNSAVVMVDFFVRHGVIKPDGTIGGGDEDEGEDAGEQHYVELVSRMHRRLPIATGPEWEE